VAGAASGSGLAARGISRRISSRSSFGCTTCACAPQLQHPLAHFAQRAEPQAQFNLAGGQFAQFLPLVPFAFANPRSATVASNRMTTRWSPAAAHHAERTGEKRPGERSAGRVKARSVTSTLAIRGRAKSAQSVAGEVVADEVPEVFAVREVVGAHVATGLSCIAGPCGSRRPPPACAAPRRSGR
jgi:hypothetical protein